MSGSASKLFPLLSALTQAACLILLGFISAKTGFVSPTSAAGIGQLVGRVALPALIFRGVAVTELGTVRWSVIVVALGAKFACMLISAAVGYAYNFKLKERLTIAGVFGIFVTNSSDSAIGIPIMVHLFPIEKYPDGPNVNYIYLLVVAQNVVIAPVYFATIALGQAKEVRVAQYLCCYWQRRLVILFAFF
jgi:predicted permease